MIQIAAARGFSERICVEPVRVSSYIFVDTLNTDFDTRAAVTKHFVQMRFQTVVRSCLDGDTNTLGSKIQKGQFSNSLQTCRHMSQFRK